MWESPACLGGAPCGPSCLDGTPLLISCVQTKDLARLPHGAVLDVDGFPVSRIS